MNVGELREALNKIDDNTQVFVKTAYNNLFSNIELIYTIKSKSPSTLTISGFYLDYEDN